MNKFFSIICLIFLINSCKDDTVTPVVENKIYFSGLTQTDNNGWFMSLDSTDWTTNDTWVKQESDLFGTTHQSGCVQSYTNSILEYPNPSSSIFMLSIDKLETTRLELRLVDRNFNSLYSNDSVWGSNVQFDARVFGVKDTIRLYYKFIENNCEFKGHGDILIK